MNIPELIENHKSAFGAYSVMALNNIQIVLDYIQEKVSLNPKAVGNFVPAQVRAGAEDLWEHPVIRQLKHTNTLKDLRPEATDAVMEQLSVHFPFVSILAEQHRLFYNKTHTPRATVNGEDLFRSLNILFRVIKTYRDYTTHFRENNIHLNIGSNFLKYSEQPVARHINEVYTVALRTIKERLSISTDDLRFIQDHRYEQYRNERGQRASRIDMEFFLSLVSHNGDKPNIHLSGVGLAFVICLFLEKKYVNVFLSKLPIYGKYRKDSTQAKIIRRSFAVNGIRLPKERLNSESSKVTVALNMLNELKRCPKELFDTLSQSEQERFRQVSSDGNEVLMMRSSDRFAQLTMQYIDYNNLFKHLRFQVNCGKIRHLLTANKNCIDGQTRVRVIEHRLNGFGRIQEVEKARKRYLDGKAMYFCTNIPVREFEDVKRDDANPENYPYVVDTRAHYIINNNKINLIDISNWDDIAKDGVLLCNPEDEEWNRNNMPELCMSTLELPAMMFHMYLCGEEATENLILRTANKYVRLFLDLKESKLTEQNLTSYGIAHCDIPQQVIESVKNNASTDFISYLKKELIKILDDTERRILHLSNDKKKINSRDNKMGKRSFRTIKSGKLADFLAEDIVRFQPTLLKGDKRGSDKMTGLNYRVMQATIATFNNDIEQCNFDNLKNLFEKAMLIGDSKRAHPFLQKALNSNPANTVDFYEHYLSARKSYLSWVLRKLENGEHVTVPFVNAQRDKWKTRDRKYYSDLAEKYVELNTIELPRQMFDSEIKQALGVPNNTDNVTHLIAEYLHNALDDDFQPFYSFNRNYRYMDMLKARFTRMKSLETNFLTLEEREKLWAQRAERIKPYKKAKLEKMSNDRNLRRLSPKEKETIIAKGIASCRNKYQKSEKMIRRFKVQDALLFLFAKLSLFEEGIKTRDIRDRKSKFKLQNIMPDSEKGILSEKLDVTMQIEHIAISARGLKIKNYGDLLALKYDKRLKSLLKLLTQSEIEKDELEQEFDTYDDLRPRLVELVMEFERMAYEKYPELEYFVDNVDHFDFKKLLSELVTRGELDEASKEILRKIRNAFNHNIYPSPEKAVVKSNNLPEIALTLTKTFEETSEI